MKFMKLGTKPDTFHTEEATRIVISDFPSDITIQINRVKYLLHKRALLPKCGLLQQLLSGSDDSATVSVDLHDIPGGDEGFELCAKFCYGVTINLSALNFVPGFCAARFLQMTEAIENGNFVAKLESFFSSCILQGWKDTIVSLDSTPRVAEWSENLGIVRRCMESIVDKILTPPSQVSWSYTYTRQGYEKKLQKSVPKDWWTEDLAFLDIDIFRCIISAVKSTSKLQPQLIGEALHVFATQWLSIPEPTESSTSKSPDNKRVLETIVGLIPADKGSVSVRFMLRLLRIANILSVSPATKAELLRLSGLQLEEATLEDLLMITDSGNSKGTDLVQNVLESFLSLWKKGASGNEEESMNSIQKVAKLLDWYLQVVAEDDKLQVQKMVSLFEILPEFARPQHNDLYKAITIYLREHPDLSKADKKQLCRILDCRKLSQEVRVHAVRNELLPLRTVVQILFFEQEKGGNTAASSSSLHRVNESGSSKSNSGSSEPGTSRSENKRQIRQEPSFKVREPAEPETGTRKK